MLEKKSKLKPADGGLIHYGCSQEGEEERRKGKRKGRKNGGMRRREKKKIKKLCGGRKEYGEECRRVVGHMKMNVIKD